MQVEMFTLCDAATCHAGKLNLLGTFDTLRFAEFPAESPPFAIVTSIRFSPDGGGQHELALVWRDADGEPIDVSETRFTQLDPIDRRDLAQDVWPFGGRTFFAPGDYQIALTVDGVAIAAIPLFILPAADD